MDKELFEQLQQSMNEAIAIAKGEIVPLKTSESEYLPSMADAAKEFGVPIRRLRWLAQEQILPVYVYADAKGLNGSLHSYARIINPSWSCDTLEFSTTEHPDAGVNYVTGFTYDMVMVRPAELQEVLNQINMRHENLTDTVQNQNRKCNLPSRQDGATIPSRKRAPITMILEYVFDECSINNPELLTPGNRDALYKFIKKKVASETKLPEGQSFSYYIDKVASTGTNRGIFMQHSIEGRKSDAIKDKWYSDAYISQLISRIRQKRKNQK